MKNEWTPKQAKLMKFLLGLLAVVLTLGILGRVVGEDGPAETEASGYCVQECQPIPAEHQNAPWADWYLDNGGDMDLYITIWAPNFVSDWTSEGESACDVLQDLFDGNIGGWNHNLDRGQWATAQYFKAYVLSWTSGTL